MGRIIMRKMVLGALAATALSSAMLEVTLAAPATLGGFAEDPGLVQKATVVCGAYSCVRVYGSYRAYAYHVPYYGYYRPWGWSDVGRPAYHVPYYGYYRPWGWSGW
jgi:hypothetical protein